MYFINAFFDLLNQFVQMLPFHNNLLWILIILYIIFIFTRPTYPDIIHSRWYHYFPDTQFEPLSFYNQVAAILESRKVPERKESYIKFRQGGFFSRWREYMRVKSGIFNFDLCAAPYGEGFFVSWWLGEDLGCLTQILLLIPLINIYVRYRLNLRTYYIMDTEAMFREAVHAAVLDAIDAMTTSKGIRALTELERQPTILRSNKI